MIVHVVWKYLSGLGNSEGEISLRKSPEGHGRHAIDTARLTYT